MTQTSKQNAAGASKVQVAPCVLTLHTMAGRNHIDLAARCLGLIVKYYDRPLHIIVHEDGSVRPEDVARFQEQIPNSSFVSKKDADPIVNESMARYPACRKLRDNLVYGLKISISTFGASGACTQTATFFCSPVSGLFRMPDDPLAGGVFMKDPIQAYCLTPLQLMQNKKLHLADRLNGGLLHFGARTSIGSVEWFLTHDEYAIHPYWKEQTAWSVLAAATRSWFWDEDQVRVITTRSELNDKITVAHYVSSYRHLLQVRSGKMAL